MKCLRSKKRMNGSGSTTHTHTHTHTHTFAHSHTRTRTRTHTDTQTRTEKHRDTNTKKTPAAGAVRHVSGRGGDKLAYASQRQHDGQENGVLLLEHVERFLWEEQHAYTCVEEPVPERVHHQTHKLAQAQVRSANIQATSSLSVSGYRAVWDFRATSTCMRVQACVEQLAAQRVS